MPVLYDYKPSQNAWKVRQLLVHLQREYRTQYVSIFEAEGQRDGFLAKNPAGAVPVWEEDDGRCLAESNAILVYLAEGSALLPRDPWRRAQVVRWLCFESDYVQSSVATLRHWVMTGKEARRDQAVVKARRDASLRVLQMLDRHLTGPKYLVDGGYSIADIAVYAYVHAAGDAGLDLAPYPALSAWLGRVRAQPGHLAQVFPYSIDPHSARELA